MFEIITNNERELTNKKLANLTNKINKIGVALTKNCFDIGCILSEIKNDNLFEDDGFKDICDYAKTMFGFGKSVTYALIKVANKFVNHETKKSIYYNEEDNKDYNYSQLEPLTQFETETVTEFVENGDINADMTVKEIKAFIKSLKEDNTEETDETTETEETDENEISENPLFIIKNLLLENKIEEAIAYIDSRL